MSFVALHGYYYRYREQRKLVKALVDTLDYIEAKTKLEEVIAEHEAKYPVELLKERKDFNFGESMLMKHAQRHLDAVIKYNDPAFVDGDNTDTPVTKHQSDIVKRSLEWIPKTDYNSTG